MSGPTRGAPNCRRVFVESETTFGSPVTQYPLAVSALRILSSTVTAKKPRRAREDGFCSASKIGSIAEKATAEWSIEFAMGTPGTAATAPDWNDLLVNALCMVQVAAVADTAISGGASTTTVLGVTSSTNFTALKSAVTVNGETRRVTAKTTGSPDTITVSPPLSAIPTALDVVTSGISYYFDDDADATPRAVTLWIMNNANQWRLTGAVATSASISGGGTTTLRMTISGVAREARQLFTGTCPAGINGAVTSMVVSYAGLVPDDVSAANPYYLTMSAGLAAEESVQVTAKAGTTYTIVRAQPSGSAQTHAAGATVEPYAPTGTYLETPIPATGGSYYAAGVLTRVESFGFELDPGLLLRENVHGTAYTVFDYIQGQRTITASAAAWSDNNPTMLRVFDAGARTATEMFAQQGDTTGYIVAAVCPNTYVEIPEHAYSADAQRLDLTGEAVGLLGEDEFFLMLG